MTTVADLELQIQSGKKFLRDLSKQKREHEATMVRLNTEWLTAVLTDHFKVDVTQSGTVLELDGSIFEVYRVYANATQRPKLFAIWVSGPQRSYNRLFDVNQVCKMNLVSLP